MNKLIAASLISTGLAASPEIGCYRFSESGVGFKAEAQIELKSEGLLDFSVAFSMMDMNLNKVCKDEKYVYDASTMTMTVASEITPCIKELQDLVAGAIQPPILMKYETADKSLNTEIVIPIKLVKAECSAVTTPAPGVPTTTAGSANKPAGRSGTGSNGNGVGSVGIISTLVMTGLLMVVF
jgi:hypothetical protein